MPRKDPRFNPKYQKNLQQKRDEENKIEGAEIGNNTILEQHLASGSVTSSKLTAISIPEPFHCSSHLSGNMTSGWVRIARLKTRSAVEFWLHVTVSGNHNMAKFVGTYCFGYGGSPSITFAMLSNSRYGNGFSDVRLVYISGSAGVYTDIYFEIYLPQAAFVSVGQTSAFGQHFDNFSNITLENGNIPSGYTHFPNNSSYANNSGLNFGQHESAILTI